MISEVEMLDETQGQRYRELAAASIALHGGRTSFAEPSLRYPRGAGRPLSESTWLSFQR